jgi:hypothetical protein
MAPKIVPVSPFGSIHYSETRGSKSAETNSSGSAVPAVLSKKAKSQHNCRNF